jgi:hypothetical protein
MRGQARGNLNRQLGDIMAQGQQNAYTQGMGQFNQEQGATQAAAQLNAQQGQFGAGLGLQGLQTALSGANTLGQLGGMQYQQNMGINSLLTCMRPLLQQCLKLQVLAVQQLLVLNCLVRLVELPKTWNAAPQVWQN